MADPLIYSLSDLRGESDGHVFLCFPQKVNSNSKDLATLLRFEDWTATIPLISGDLVVCEERILYFEFSGILPHWVLLVSSFCHLIAWITTHFNFFNSFSIIPACINADPTIFISQVFLKYQHTIIVLPCSFIFICSFVFLWVVVVDNSIYFFFVYLPVESWSKVNFSWWLLKFSVV